MTNATPGARVEATAGARLLLPAPPTPLLLPARCPARVALDTVVCADALDFLRGLPSESVNCVVTSPPYFGLRDYGVAGQWGLEATPQEHVAKMVALFHEVRRVLRDDGVLWLNYGDSYSSQGGPVKDEFKKILGTSQAMLDASKYDKSRGAERFPGLVPKNLLGMPWRVAFGLQDDGWILRSDVIWAKPNPMPESVTDRPTKSHEYVFLFSKSQRYWWDQEAVREAAGVNFPVANNTWESRKQRGEPVRRGATPYDTAGFAPGGYAVDPAGRNLRSVWTIPTEPTPFAHFATFPQRLVERCILAGCPPKVCASCGAPWVREVEREFIPQQDVSIERGMKNAAGLKPMYKDNGWVDTPRGTTSTQTIRWHPTCACHADTSPGLVLDPFIGSGTVGLVARRLGRHFIGSELNPEYVKLCNERLAVPYTLPLPLTI